ncbi:MAG: hypothetical protein U0V70_10415 [Terriglobia bacterium]
MKTISHFSLEGACRLTGLSFNVQLVKSTALDGVFVSSVSKISLGL